MRRRARVRARAPSTGSWGAPESLSPFPPPRPPPTLQRAEPQRVRGARLRAARARGAGSGGWGESGGSATGGRRGAQRPQEMRLRVAGPRWRWRRRARPPLRSRRWARLRQLLYRHPCRRRAGGLVHCRATGEDRACRKGGATRRQPRRWRARPAWPRAGGEETLAWRGQRQFELGRDQHIDEASSEELARDERVDETWRQLPEQAGRCRERSGCTRERSQGLRPRCGSRGGRRSSRR